MKKIGVDLSAWNNLSDIKKAKDNGLGFVIIKAGSGVTPVDGKFNVIYEQCKKYNMPVGTYWYLYSKTVTGALNEAGNLLKNIKGKQFEYPIWLDFEDPSQANLSRKTKTEIAIAFMNKIEKNGYYIGLYTMGSWFNNAFDYSYNYQGRTLKEFDKWVAHWTHSISKKSSYIDKNTGIWQYTNKGNFAGIGKAGNGLDMNVAFKDYPKIIKEKGLNGFSKNSLSKKDLPNIYNMTGVFKIVKPLKWTEELKKSWNIVMEYFNESEKSQYIVVASGQYDFKGTNPIIIVDENLNGHTKRNEITKYLVRNEKEASILKSGQKNWNKLIKK
ncbi:MAG: GH25 family lysozyme [Miniphocaeibacter sp.]|uniref:GH25 family lysozyme n=1 Tax=Miniphocaeibacter sp. TaxID=3100973 RepID=UPI003BB19B1E